MGLVLGHADDRMACQPTIEGGDLIEEVVVPATGEAFAHGVPCAAQRRRRLRLERIERLVIGAIEHEVADKTWVPDCEHLSGVAAVGITVEVDLADVDRFEHRPQVLSDGRAAIGIGPLTEPPSTGSDHRGVVAWPGEGVVFLRARAVDGI